MGRSYKIIDASDTAILEIMVDELMKEGWEPVGAPFLLPGNMNIMQAMKVKNPK
jgi:hypothetical protein